MKILFSRLLRGEKGAQYIEYVIALALLAVVFLVVGREIGEKGRERGEESMSAAQDIGICGAALLASGPDACK